MRFDNILAKYRAISFSERDKGDRFERLMQAYLKTTPTYASLFREVWLWQEFPGRHDLGGGDTGIDLVALTVDGDYWAVQCKCYQESAIIDKPAVDSFLSTSSRTFRDENLHATRFARRLWIATTNHWGANAREAVKNQDPPVSILRLYDLTEAAVDWEKLETGIHGEAARTPRKALFEHQRTALEKAHAHYRTANRGKLIMACGTGKTFTSLRIAEHETNGVGFILFLVPSIALLGQTLREWSADAANPINAICICSDPKVSKSKSRDEDTDLTSVVDLALPASTDIAAINHQFLELESRPNAPTGLTVVFSTYQSIDVIAQTQKRLLSRGSSFSAFDLIVCDEAHRTTGIKLATDEDESAFTKVHDNTYIQAAKRLYMTATPRLYSDDSKSKAAEAEAVLCSMDDENLYGTEIYRIGFGEAVERNLLTDYKVMIFTLRDGDIPPSIQEMIADENDEINTDDASKLIGCINALSKRVIGDDGTIQATDPAPMRRAVAFCQSIAVSKRITAIYNRTADTYIAALPEDERTQTVSVVSRHVDGTMSALERDDLLGWLKADGADGECRILTNVRCLSEGVDVPSLDAVLFLSARNSPVDVVQSVGRVMRKAPGKKYGYIIIPILVPSNIEADKALDDNERYKVVWTVLNALRAHDDRFNATVNKIELNKKRPAPITVVGARDTFGSDGKPERRTLKGDETEAGARIAQQLSLRFQELQEALFARMVTKVGDRRYWEQWAKSVADIAERQVERINRLIREEGSHQKAFEGFLMGLQKNINPNVTQQEAVEMLSQHIITKPVFDALFEGYSFVQNNPISVSMQSMLDLLEAQAIEKDTVTLAKFYESVKMRASGIDNAEGKQRIIIELYDKFFKTAFPKMVEKLGIVYTPVEVVDFMLQSVDDMLRQEFGRGITDENVHLLDPFTGTGTFVTRLLQSGLIEKKDLVRKYTQELHANEIVLLAYYIAAVNIENAFHDAMGGEYLSFDGICLTDTFQLGEPSGDEVTVSDMFPKNTEQVERQKNAPLRVIMGNPPYSVGQRSANDNAQNQRYMRLDGRVGATYAKETDATNKNSLYNSYFKAFRWASDRLDSEYGGIICFVSDGGWLDSNSQDGFRKCIEREFSSIYVFNLRGDARSQGELRRKEAGNVFGSGSRQPITITVLVKNPEKSSGEATIHYHDIGDYLNREEKLAIIKQFGSVANHAMPWRTLHPNEHADWLNQRSDVFDTFIEVTPQTKFSQQSQSFFSTNSNGLQTNRDAWVYNFSSDQVEDAISALVNKYNNLLDHSADRANNFIESNDQVIKWSSSLVAKFEAGVRLEFSTDNIWRGIYRPYCKQFICRHDALNHRPYQLPKLFPTPTAENRLICVSGVGVTKDFSAIITDTLPDLELIGKSQCFPLYYYEEQHKQTLSLFDANTGPDYIRRDGVTDFILTRARKQYGKAVTKEDIFYYVYGFLHSPDYRTAFAADLKKMLPRLPLVDSAQDFWAFSKAGRTLADLHINYETVPPHPDVTVTGESSRYFTVEKMRFPAKDQKDTIHYNSHITLSHIPPAAYDYIVNGKSAIEWIMERYAITTHKDSGITNDPNDWAKETGNPRYILDLLLSVIHVSTQTVDIVAGLPRVSFA
jgi:predicted helicase